MSHTVKIHPPGLKDPALLQKAFENCGWQVVRNSLCRTWMYNEDRTKVYELVANNPHIDGYDVGIVKQENGEYILEGDFSMMGRDVWNALGKDFSKVIQNYSYESIMAWASTQNGQVSSNVLENGIIEMEIEIQ
jgi:hypothetical protein